MRENGKQELVILQNSVLHTNVVQSSLGACSDLRATTLFLEHIAARNKRTAQEYAREVGRLLMWLAVQQKTITGLTYSELKDYQDDLDRPAALSMMAARLPTQRQVDEFEQAFAIGQHGPRNGARPAPGQRARNARPVLLSYLKWLADAGHRPPIAVPRVAGEKTSSQRVAEARESINLRKLPQELWNLVDVEIESMDWTDPSQCVERTMLIWLRWTGVRRAVFTGALRHDISDPVQRQATGQSYRFWTIRSKGGTVRRVPLNEPMTFAYRQYRNTMAPLLADKDVDEATANALFVLPVGKSKVLRPANGRDLYVAVAAMASRAAVRANNPEDRAQLLQLRPHWFRHRRAFELEQSVSLSAAAAFLGHASVTTTQIYSTAEELDLAEMVYGRGH